MYASDARHDVPSLERKLANLFTLRGGPTIDLTIRPDYYELLRRLGNPHDSNHDSNQGSLPPVIHVAGTNGKGSTVATMRAILAAAGYRVHVYTSPHLVRFNERIVLAGREIDDRTLEIYLDEVTAAATGLPLTFFEITTALAFAAFARTPADVTLLETGMGGRLDATNVVKHPAATVITPIGLDHREYLGDTLIRIAGEKAGIMKRGVTCTVAPQSNPAIHRVFESRAAEVFCGLQAYGVAWRIENQGGSMTHYMGDDRLDLPLPSLPGRHQIDNAGTAITCLRTLPGFTLTRDDYARGLTHIEWPGRLQRIDRLDLPPGWELWIDGGHNEHAARALAAQAGSWAAMDKRPLHLVVGMLTSRDPAEFLTPLLPHAASLTGVPIPDQEKSHAPEDIIKNVGFPLPCQTAPHPVGAVRAILDRFGAGGTGRILVTGSLYLPRYFL